ncbi:MAG: PHP domain-containing protein [Epulopiscium sp.]|nr:PHP domain-containing protein [Candidatus Epulonipiscium sp.]
MRYYYDLHIHTALSPCGNEDMTPNNIVNMALLKELDIIAITDHNSAENVAAVVNVAKNTPLLVIPGMEIETAEEVHIVALFPSIKAVQVMQEWVYETLPPLQNRVDIFGAQRILNAEDEMIGENPRLLLTATSLPLKETLNRIQALHGVGIPAHVDRNSYSILSNLGAFPPDLYIPTIEISKHLPLSEGQQQFRQKKVIQSSDAHYLGDIAEAINYLDLPSRTIEALLEYLSQRKE